MNHDGEIVFQRKEKNDNQDMLSFVKAYNKLPNSYYQNVTINGKPAIQVEYTMTPELEKYIDAQNGSDDLGRGAVTYGLKTFEVYVENNNHIIDIAGETMDDTDAFKNDFNAIISTLEFDT